MTESVSNAKLVGNKEDARKQESEKNWKSIHKALTVTLRCAKSLLLRMLD